MMTGRLFFILIALWNYTFVRSKYVSGTLATTERWHFLVRFCFMSKKGMFNFTATYPKEYATQNVLLYYDEPDQWPAAYETVPEKNCTAKHAILKPENRQVVPLDSRHCQEGTINGADTYSCKLIRHFTSARDRWWYIAIDNCNGKGLKLNYEIWLTNGDRNETLRRQFSADEFNIFETDVAFLVINTILFILSCNVAGALKKMQMLHSTYNMYLASVGCQVFYLLLMSIAYGQYMNDGIERSGLIVMGRVVEYISFLVFLLLVILLGKGYTVTRGRLRSASCAKIAVYMTIYVVTFIVLLIWEQYVADPGKVLYLYESPPGYVLVALKLLGLVWFLYAVFFTVKHFPEKIRFYILFSIFYSMWFIGVPVVVLLANLAISKHMRAKLVNGVQLSISFLAHLIFLILTRPTAANDNFPYHVKTQQIDVAGGFGDGVEENNSTNMDMFRAHAYVSNTSEGAGRVHQFLPDSTDIFTTTSVQGSPPLYSSRDEYDDENTSYNNNIRETNFQQKPS